MTDTETDTFEAKRRARKTVRSLVIGGVAGFLATFLVMQFVDAFAVDRLGFSREAALLVGLIYVLLSIAIAFGVFLPDAGEKFLNVEDGDELREQRAMLSANAVGSGALGAALMVAALSGEGAVFGATSGLIGFLALVIVSIGANVVSFRRQDELMRAVNNESMALSYTLIVIAGGGWAALTHFGVVGQPQALDWLTFFFAIMLIATFIVAGLRGMLATR